MKSNLLLQEFPEALTSVSAIKTNLDDKKNASPHYYQHFAKGVQTLVKFAF